MIQNLSHLKYQSMTWKDFSRPLVCLAPMDGITNTAYRRIVRGLSTRTLLFSEFTSVNGLLRSERLQERMKYHPSEHPFFMQLFGNDPRAFAEVSRIVEDRGIMGVDINMGCPSKKIVNSQHGSALMKDVDGACRIIEAIRSACNLEVSVKTRLGWENADNLITFAKSLEAAGSSLVTIHGRTYRQAFKGNADWDPIYELKRNLSIPVVGNGDVRDYSDGIKKTKNLDGFMIGRSAIGNPWVFCNPNERASPSLSERVEVAIRHYELLREFQTEQRALREFRKYLGEYVQGFRYAKEQRKRLMTCEREEDFLQQMREIASWKFSNSKLAYAS
jgi:tRNA-dihydrouridine synthase B